MASYYKLPNNQVVPESQVRQDEFGRWSYLNNPTSSEGGWTALMDGESFGVPTATETPYNSKYGEFGDWDSYDSMRADPRFTADKVLYDYNSDKGFLDDVLPKSGKTLDDLYKAQYDSIKSGGFWGQNGYIGPVERRAQYAASLGLDPSAWGLTPGLRQQTQAQAANDFGGQMNQINNDSYGSLGEGLKYAGLAAGGIGLATGNSLWSMINQMYNGGASAGSSLLSGLGQGEAGAFPTGMDVTGSSAASGSFTEPQSWADIQTMGPRAGTQMLSEGWKVAGDAPGILGTDPTSIGDYASQFTGGGPEAWTDPALSESLANMSGNVQAASATQSGNLWDTILSKLKTGVGNEINKATNNPISTAIGLYGGLRNMFSEQTRANDIRSGYSNAAQLASPVNSETRQRYQAMLQQAMTNPESLIQEGGPLAGITKVYNDATQRAMAAKGRRLNPADLQNENYKTFLGTILPNYTKQLADLGGFQFNPGQAGQIMAGGILPAAQAEANSQGALPFALQAIFGRANMPTRGVNGQLVGG